MIYYLFLLIKNIENKKKLYRTERSKLNIYQHPFLISKYFCLYLLETFREIGRFILSHLIAISLIIFLVIGGIYFVETNVDHEVNIKKKKKKKKKNIYIYIYNIFSMKF